MRKILVYLDEPASSHAQVESGAATAPDAALEPDATQPGVAATTSVATTLPQAQQEALTLAASLGEVFVVTTSTPQRCAETLSYTEISRVITGATAIASSDAAAVDLVAAAVAQIRPDAIFTLHSIDSLNTVSRVAARTGSGLITQAVNVTPADPAPADSTSAHTSSAVDATPHIGGRPGLRVTKSVVAGNYITTSVAAGAESSTADSSPSAEARMTSSAPLIITLKPQSTLASLTPASAAHRPAVESLDIGGSAVFADMETTTLEVSPRPGLTEAATVVACGRGIDGDLTLIEELADELHAGIGATRAVTDAGWIEHSAQVGQTGATVSPRLYISVGISGAIQQRTGMQTSGTIVAINKDEDAPVFEIADFGIVGDLNDVIPQVIAELRRRSGNPIEQAS